MNIVVPMAGRGARFAEAGFDTPKPLIDVCGVPMYARAAGSLPLDQATSLVFVVAGDLPGVDRLRTDIKQRFGQYSPQVLALDEPTSGQAETVERAAPFLDATAPLLIHNADTAVVAPSDWCNNLVQRGADGGLLVFRGGDERWSFARLDDVTGLVVEVREKQVISPWATTGTYWFRLTSTFMRLAEDRRRVGATEAGEFYVAPIYDDLIAQGGRVLAVEVEDLQVFGTPSELATELARMVG